MSQKRNYFLKKEVHGIDGMLAVAIDGMSSRGVLEMVSKQRGVRLAVACLDIFSKEALAMSATVSVHALKFGGNKHHPMGLVKGIRTRGASPGRDGNSTASFNVSSGRGHNQ